MGIKLDYAHAKAEADLNRYLESGLQNAPNALCAAVCYLKTLTAGLIAEHLRPDSRFPETAVADFRSAITGAEDYLWESQFSAVAWVCDCDFSKTDYSSGLYHELSQLWDHAVTEFWSQRAEYLAKLGGGPLPSAVSAGPDNKPSDEPARPEPPTVDGVATSGSSKSEADGGAVPAPDEARPAQPDQIADGSIVMHTISDLLRDIDDSSLPSPRDALIDGLEATRGRHIAELLGAIPSSQLPPLGQLSKDSWNLVDETLFVLAGEILSGVFGSLISHNAGIYEETAESLARRVRDFIVRIWGRFVGEQAPESDYFCFVEQLDITIHEVRHEHVARAWRMHEESYRESAKRIGSVVAPKQTRAVGNAGISADPAPESIHAELGGATDMGEGSGDGTSPGLKLPTRQRPGKERKGDAPLLVGPAVASRTAAERVREVAADPYVRGIETRASLEFHRCAHEDQGKWWESAKLSGLIYPVHPSEEELLKALEHPVEIPDATFGEWAAAGYATSIIFANANVANLMFSVQGSELEEFIQECIRIYTEKACKLLWPASGDQESRNRVAHLIDLHTTTALTSIRMIGHAQAAAKNGVEWEEVLQILDNAPDGQPQSAQPSAGEDRASCQGSDLPRFPVDSKTSDEAARAEPPTTGGAAGIGASKSDQAGGAVPATVASTGNAINRRGAEVITGSAPLSLPARQEPDAARADEGAARPDFPRRAAWLKERLIERAWNRNDPLRQRGPDPKTIDKVLRGEPVREDVLEKLAKALSKKHAIVALLDIPQD
jgi:hypothetical protein